MNTFRLFNLNLLHCCWQHVRKVGNFKRSGMLLAQEQVQELRNGILKTRTQLSTPEWQEIRQSLINNQKTINSKNIDALILGLLNDAQQLQLAKNYVHELRSTGTEPNSATLGRLLRTYNAAYHMQGSLASKDEEEILNICKELRSKHELLDAITCEHLIHGYVTTSQWREAVPILDMIKLTSAPPIAAYTELILKSFKENDLKLGLELLHEMLQNRKQPKCEIFLAYLKTINRHNKMEDIIIDLEILFNIVEQYDLLITELVANSIEKIVQQTLTKSKVAITRINTAGKCQNCGQFMSNIAISDEEFTKLRDEFMERVLVRKDVFQKSTPEEVEKFKNFVDATAPYDCVIDGLNVAYSMGNKKSPKQLANLVAVVVKYFKQRQKHVLVLGRKHMNSWPKNVMQYVRQNANIFLTNNLTHDDPFMLYATLKSGPTTDFFSRDLMRAHAFLLGPELKTIFRRWQQEHQYSLLTHTQNGNIIVKEPIRYRIYAHRVKSTWHLPLKQEFESHVSDTFEIPKNWLCIEMSR